MASPKQKQEMTRSNRIVVTSIVGIIANIVLAVFKVMVGTLANSIAIVLDGVNNISDALSSVVTIIGTKLAGRAPDKKHPLGYGRIEYLTSMVIAVIVLYAGITSMIESIKKLIHPDDTTYSTLTFAVICVAVVVKLLLGWYVKKVGKEVKSDALIGSGEDATLDAVVSVATMAAAVGYRFFHIRLEAVVGIIIAFLIIKAGLDLLKEAVSNMLGNRIESSFSREIKETIKSVNGVSGAYDLVLNNYGPDSYIGSCHIEVKDTMSAFEIEKIEREIVEKVAEKHRIILTGISIYAKNTKDDEAAQLEKEIRKMVTAHEYCKGMHGFYLNKEKKYIRFDVVIEYSAKPSTEAVGTALWQEVQKAYPDYQVLFQIDADISD
ncbi:MAG: cation diffusion facilitator family transporter [Eubacterium sp.]|nr:cation diffusion facilitator family transporter [Eubacterium sp.]